MDRVEQYREAVKKVMRAINDYVSGAPDFQTELVLDDVNGHYELLNIGWHNKRRIHNSVIHIDIRNEKVYVEHDGTDLEVVKDLLEAGIPAKHIVLGFHLPQHRQYTEFGIS